MWRSRKPAMKRHGSSTPVAATNMCGKKELFSGFDDSFRESLKLGNNSRMTVMEKATYECK